LRDTNVPKTKVNWTKAKVVPQIKPNKQARQIKAVISPVQDYHLPGQGPKRNNYPNSVALGTAKVLKVAIPERLAHQAPVPEIGLHQQNVTLFIILVTSSSSGSRDRRRYRTDMTTGRPWSGKISRLRKDSLPLNSRIGIRSICSNRTGMEIGGRESLCIPDIRRF